MVKRKSSAQTFQIGMSSENYSVMKLGVASSSLAQVTTFYPM